MNDFYPNGLKTTLNQVNHSNVATSFLIGQVTNHDFRLARSSLDDLLEKAAQPRHVGNFYYSMTSSLYGSCCVFNVILCQIVQYYFNFSFDFKFIIFLCPASL